MTLTGTEVVGLVSAWYAVGVGSVAFYELARNGFRYFQKQDVVRSFFYGILGPVTTVYAFLHITTGRRFEYLRRELVEKVQYKDRVWQNKEEHLRDILNKRYEDDRKCEDAAPMAKSVSGRNNVQTIHTHMPPVPSQHGGGMVKKGRP